MLELLGLLGALVAGLSIDAGGADKASDNDDQDLPEEEAWGVSSTFFEGASDPQEDATDQDNRDAAEPEGDETDHGGTKPDGQPISNDIPDPVDPDLSLRGTDAADQLSGRSGHDTLTAGSGDDHADGRAGNDSLSGDAGHDQLHGAAGTDVLAGGDGDDSLWGDLGDDDLAGGNGDDLLAGAEGNDRAGGGAGDDSLTGGTGNDALNGGEGVDILLGGEGDDLVTGGTGADEVDGGTGNDTLWGTDANSTDQDVDFLNGGEGDDLLHLGAGDYGHSGAGADTFALQDFAPGSPLVQITDFDPDEDQLLILYDAALHPDPQLSLQTSAGPTILLLDGVPLASLSNGAAVDLGTIRLQAA